MTTPDHTAELLDCPFCGENDIAHLHTESLNDGHYIVCLRCGGKSGMWSYIEEATEAWNTRTANTLHAQLEREQKENAALRAEKDNAYWERNRLVAILARQYPSGMAVTDIPGWDAEWHNCVYIDTPRGQLSWHIHDNEMMQFAGLPEYKGKWDGHDTGEKYRRLLLLLLDASAPKALNPSPELKV